MRLFGVDWGSTHRLGTESTEHVCDVQKIPSIRKVEILSGKKKYFFSLADSLKSSQMQLLCFPMLLKEQKISMRRRLSEPESWQKEQEIMPTRMSIFPKPKLS